MNKVLLSEYIKSVIPISPATVDLIVNEFEEKTFLKNEFFLREGKLSNEYLFLEDGYMRAYTIDTDGNEVTTNLYGPHRVIFEVSSLFLRTKAPENIQAITNCKGLVLPFEKLNLLFHSVPEFREFGRAMLVKEFVRFKQRTIGLINQTAEERYSDFLNNNGDIFQHAQLKHIASFLGVTDTSLSRIRKEMSQK